MSSAGNESSSSSNSAPEAARPPLSAAESRYARELFERHQMSLLRYLGRVLRSRDEASDILQETYLRFMRQPGLEKVALNAKAYLFRTAMNIARDRFRTRALKGLEAERQVFTASGLGTPRWETWPDLMLEGEQLGELIEHALESMRPNVRTALLLYRLQGLRQAEIATRLGVSERMVERYVREGLQVIASALEEHL